MTSGRSLLFEHVNNEAEKESTGRTIYLKAERGGGGGFGTEDPQAILEAIGRMSEWFLDDSSFFQLGTSSCVTRIKGFSGKE